MKKRPFVFLLVPFIAGIFVADRINYSLHFLAIPAIAFSGLILIFILARKYPQIAFFILLTLLFLTGWSRIRFQQKSFNQFTIRNYLNKPMHTTVTVRIKNDPEILHEGMRAVVSAESLQVGNRTIPVTGNILLRWRQKQPKLETGDLISATGTGTVADGERNPGEFNYRQYLKRRMICGIFYVGRKEKINIIKRNPAISLTSYLFTAPRNFIAHVFRRYITKVENAALLKGLILGLRGEITPEIRTEFANTGVIHVLAVSGLHVGYVTIFLLGLAFLFPLPSFYRTVFVMLGLLYYAGLTGFKPPVVRAVIMADLFFLGELLQRRRDVYNILAAAAFLILLFKPQALFDVGFQLSFTAVFSIIFLYSKAYAYFKGKGFLPKNRILHGIFQLFLVSISAQLGTLPLTIIYFSRIPLLATFANLIVVPLVQVIVILGFALIAVAAIWAGPATVIGMIISALLSILTFFVGSLSSLPFVKLDVSFLSPFVTLFIFSFLLLMLLTMTKRRYGYTIILLFLLADVTVWSSVFKINELRLTYLDIGQGDACLIELPDKRAFLIDTGPHSQNYDAGSRTIIPYLKRRHISKLDAIFISHSHNDHSGGLYSIAQQIKVKKVYTVNVAAEKPEEDFVAFCDSLHLPVQFLSAGDIVSCFEPLQIQVLSPFRFMLKKNSGFDVNETSQVLRLIYGHHHFLFCGDMEKQTENVLLLYDSFLRAEILKSPHHGSKTSSTLPFLQKVHPNWTVISVGKWNRFHHPSRSVLRRLKQESIKYIRTDENGAVIFTSDGNRLRRVR